MKTSFPKLKFKLKYKYHKKILHTFRITFWFLTGAFLALIFITSFGLFAYERVYENRIYPGIYLNNVNFGGKTKQEVIDFFSYKNSLIGGTDFVLTSDYGIATISAKQIDFGYDANLSAEQAYSIGRSKNELSNLSLILQAYISGIHLPTTYTYNRSKFTKITGPIAEKIEKKPVDALFKFENNRVTAFKPSGGGQTVDIENLENKIYSQALTVMSSDKPRVIIIPVPIKTIEPKITTDKVNNLGIKELIGEGHSLFYHSIPSRIYNINLAQGRLNGVLVAPGEVFSFDKTLGDVSAFTGYKQAYVIQNGKTVLGDGGGVCQVSTTFFRALVNAGLPIVERHAHAYRVGYYEQDSPPGIDATIYVPSVDLKFKNDTGNYILIQSQIDLDNLSLSFYLYGTKDGRKVTMTKPVISNQTPPPETLYQDDPTLPKGEIKQTDFAAWGANVYFTRTVTKDGKQIIYDKFVSNYQPWQAVYLRGTKE
ncbi:MAG: VanW family protein [Patescibacteria group bacterium]|nr:VanW family protein [Patescibacteria group bacterium]